MKECEGRMHDFQMVAAQSRGSGGGCKKRKASLADNKRSDECDQTNLSGKGKRETVNLETCVAIVILSRTKARSSI